MRHLLVIELCAASAATAVTSNSEWPQWRGPFNTGMAEGDAPLHWDDTLDVELHWSRPRQKRRGFEVSINGWI